MTRDFVSSSSNRCCCLWCRPSPLVAKDIDDILKFFFNRITKSDDTEIEKWCLVAVGRVVCSFA
jgi:hypothetical protein